MYRKRPTAPNRTVYASPPVGGSAHGCACSTTLFCFVPRPCGLPLSTEWTWITAQNKGAHGVRPGWAHPTSYTAGTLGAIGLKLVEDFKKHTLKFSNGEYNQIRYNIHFIIIKNRKNLMDKSRK